MSIAIGVLVVLAAIVLKIMGGFSNRQRSDLLKELVEASALTKTDSSALKIAVIQCDALLGKALTFHGVKGETVGELLKNAQGRFEDNLYEDLWQVHKLRNTLVHEKYDLGLGETKDAVSVYTSAIRRLVK